MEFSKDEQTKMYGNCQPVTASVSFDGGDIVCNINSAEGEQVLLVGMHLPVTMIYGLLIQAYMQGLADHQTRAEVSPLASVSPASCQVTVDYDGHIADFSVQATAPEESREYYLLEAASLAAGRVLMPVLGEPGWDGFDTMNDEAEGQGDGITTPSDA